MLQEMKFYLDQLKQPNVSHRKISHRFSTRFRSSPSAIKDILLREGYIELDYIKREGATQKFNHYFKLTGKQLADHGAYWEVKKDEPEKEVAFFWDDGTPKSSNNAFDWKRMKSNLYNTRELVQAQQKYHNNHPISVYSRA